MKAQLQRLGISYDWATETTTCLPEYYRFNQWFFLRMLDRGLAYRAKRKLNWCPRCATVLAEAQITPSNTCWRHEDTQVEKVELDQWFLKITDYRDRLLEGLRTLEGGWPERVLTAQREWIGRSEGCRFSFAVEGSDDTIEVFTTRVDTVYGCSAVFIAAGHPLTLKLAAGTGQAAAVAAFVAEETAGPEAAPDEKQKRGVFTGRHAINPFNGDRVPVWAANFVLAEFGTGAVFAQPAHDQRDFEFAKKYGLPIDVVIRPDGQDLDSRTMTGAYEGPGRMVNSDRFSGLSSEEGKKAVTDFFEERKIGRGKVQYRLRDWGVSRQRYWGCPIPVVHCPACGLVPVPEKDLPVVLPEDLPYTREKGNPLAAADEWARVPCPSCGGPARRETDTFDTFVESSWYFHRYIDPRNDREPLSAAKMRSWMPVDQYVGGVEHACMHLIYSRFFHKYLRDKGLVPGNEPFTRLLSQGMVCMSTLECPKHGWRYPEEVDASGLCRQCGEKVEVGRSMKMSKSKRNVVEPSALVERYGADTARLFSLFAAPPEKDLDWSEQGVEGAYRFLGRVYRLIAQKKEAVAAAKATPAESDSAESRKIRQVTHRTLKKVTGDVEDRFRFNTAISAVMEMVNFLYLVDEEAWTAGGTAPALREAAEIMLHMLSPFAPHIAEELWEMIGNTGLVSTRAWPIADEEMARAEEILVVVQINGKLRSKITADAQAGEDEVRAMVMADPRVREYTDGKTIRKFVYVPKKLVSLVVA
jgi:leucyl-tRNA synthetase